MRGTSHLFFGFFTAAATALDLGYTENFVFGACIGSLLPDIDQPNSIIGQGLPVCSTVINKIYGHRGFTHSFLFPALIYVFTQERESFNGIAFGCLGHMLLDFFNTGGIPLLYPFTKKTYRIAKIKSGSPKSEYLTYVLTGLYLMAVIGKNYLISKYNLLQ